MKEILISVIIPAYNIKPYIEKCVDSVLMQTYKNLEVIIVDDGSTDGTSDTCNEIKEKDQRITVIHQKNQGLSVARNNGMDAAKGDYIAFLDGDDLWQGTDIINKLAKEIVEKNLPDVVICSFAKRNVIDGSLENHIIQQIKTDSIYKYKEQLLRQGKYHNAAWSKIYKKSFLDANKLKFPVGRISEDLVWSRIILTKCETISILSQPLVEYQVGRGGSITSSFSQKNYIDIYDQMKMDLNQIKILSEENIKLAYAFWAEQCCWYFSYFDVSGKDLKTTIHDNEFAFDIMKYGMSKRSVLINLAIRIIGKTVTVKALIAYQHRRLY